MKKYELVNETKLIGTKFVAQRIRALRDIPFWNVKAGDYGGFIASEESLSQTDDSWVETDAKVLGDKSRISGNIRIGKRTIIENSIINGNGYISGRIRIWDSELIVKSFRIQSAVSIDECHIRADELFLSDKANLYGVKTTGELTRLTLSGESNIEANEDEVVLLSGSDIKLTESAKVIGAHSIHGHGVDISGHATLAGGASILGTSISLKDHVRVNGNVQIEDNVHLSDFVEIDVAYMGAKVKQIWNVDISGDSRITE